MLRAVRFAASHDFVVERAAWETLCELSPAISRVSPARIYEEIQKLFLLGSARPAFRLLEKSGLLAALFPGLGRWIYGDSRRLALLDANLECLDQLYRSGTPPSPAFFLAALFGPSLEESALARHRDGIPYRHALDVTCATFMQETLETASIPGRVGDRLRAILVLQASLHRRPPRRPASVIARPEFREALAYLRFAAETRREHRIPLEWWDRFLLESPSIAPSEAPTDEPPAKRRRRRRHGRRGAPKTAA
jgi:poly(A) polymerase